MSTMAVNADGTLAMLVFEKIDPEGHGGLRAAIVELFDLTNIIMVYSTGFVNESFGPTINVIASKINPDIFFLYGRMGGLSGEQVQVYDDSTGVVTDISPSGLGANIVNALVVNPLDDDELIASVDTNRTIRHTTDGGTSWNTIATSLLYDATALLGLFTTDFFNEIFMAGNLSLTPPTQQLLEYSADNGTTREDLASIPMRSISAVIGMEVL